MEETVTVPNRRRQRVPTTGMSCLRTATRSEVALTAGGRSSTRCAKHKS